MSGEIVTEQQEIIAAASSGYPPGAAEALFVSQHGDHAAVLLETGSGSHSYPYFVLCDRKDGGWAGGASGVMPGWYQTEGDAGVVVFWTEAEGLSEPVELWFKGQRWPSVTKGAVVVGVWWDELDPSNYIEPEWPEIASPS